MSAVLVLALAMGLDALTGEPRWLWSRVPHPAVLLGKVVTFLDQHLNAGRAKRVKGVIAAAALVIGAWVIGRVISEAGPWAECLIAAILLAHRSLIEHVAAVADGLRYSLGAGRRAVKLIVSRDVSSASEDDIARAAIESLSENFSDGVMAPAFWFLLGGLPGLCVYKAVNTADSMVGYLTPRYKEFGWAAARLDDLLNWVPARVTAVLISLVGGVFPDHQGLVVDAMRHRSPNAGWPEAAMAQALGIALAGPRSYHGQIQDLAWVNGSGRRVLTPADIDDAVAVIWKAWALVVFALFATGVLIWIF